MSLRLTHRAADPRIRCHTRGSAFSLVELLTVIFIISLLIGILIPSLGAARNAAKKSKTNSDLRAIGTALELFKNDNERDFPHTNGYPPSFAHPPVDRDNPFDPILGEFPFQEDVSESDPPVVYGAHWLPAMLMGVDNLGYVKRSAVPPDLRAEPWKWYSEEPNGPGSKPLPRANFYIEPEGVKTVLTQNLRGRRPPDSAGVFPDWDNMKELPVMVDAFDQPILYYAANRHGSTANMVAEERDTNNQYTGGPQQEGPPIYFHQDNTGFTGTSEAEENIGWNFGGGAHPIARSGHELTADQLVDPASDYYKKNFAWYILDAQLRRKFDTDLIEGNEVRETASLKPVNPDSFLLISAGADGLWGTNDDVTNFPLSAE
jgi:type II secretory pathway pseudopilin PulG